MPPKRLSAIIGSSKIAAIQPKRRRIAKETEEPPLILLSLPNEILMQIFQYLSPPDILELCTIGSNRITKVTYAIRDADFHLCESMHFEHFRQFFIKYRANSIRKMNVSFITDVPVSIITACAIKCSHITSLSVMECGVTFEHVQRIFTFCKTLEEFYWNVNGIESIRLCTTRSAKFVAPNMKKLYLLLEKGSNLYFSITADLIYWCVSASEVYVNFASCFITYLPCAATSVHFIRVRSPIPNGCDITLMLNYRPMRDMMIVEEISDRIYAALRKYATLLPGLQKVDVTKSENYTSLIWQPPFLQLRSSINDVITLSSMTDNSISTLVYLFTLSTSMFKKDVIDGLVRVTGKKLKTLFLKDIADLDTVAEANLALNFSGKRACFIDFAYKKLLTNCLNVTEVDFSELHIEVEFGFYALSGLQFLKKLALSSCSLGDNLPSPYIRPETEEEAAGIPPSIPLEEMISKCPLVTHFTLIGCPWCDVGPTDAKLCCLANWKGLNCLKFQGVPTLRKCHFLKHVSDSCKNLKSLEFLQVGHLGVCHYIPYVNYVLQNSQNLVFLRVNQRAFHPSQETFWKAVNAAKKLRGLCLSTNLDAYFEWKNIRHVAAQLERFHLFHFFSPRHSAPHLKALKKDIFMHGFASPRVFSNDESSILFPSGEDMEGENLVTGCHLVHFDFP